MHTQFRNAFKLMIGCYRGKIAFQCGCSNERVHISNQADTMWGAKVASNVSIAFQDTVGKKIGIDFTKKYLKLFLAVGEIRQTFEIFNHLSIYHNACCCLTMLY